MKFLKWTLFMLVALTSVGILFAWQNGTYLYNKQPTRHESTDIGTDDVRPFASAYIGTSYPLMTEVKNDTLVIYNRVSKCASTTMTWTLKMMQLINHFHVSTESMPLIQMEFNKQERKEFAERILSLPRDTVFVRHFYFVNFSEFGLRNPIYINIIRNPVDRFISRYYYARYGFKKTEKSNVLWPKWPISLKRMNTTLEECVLTNVTKCFEVELYKPMMMFFCGDHFNPKCGTLSRFAVERSIENIQKHYLVVGLVEDFPNTFKVFEKLLPRYFEGSWKKFQISPEKNLSKSSNRKEPSENVKKVLKIALKTEIEFYEFVKKRFYEQLNRLRELKMINDDNDSTTT
ncbi:uronyl 2-sulfotransferase-like isoform X1 [Clavelina lepadiformis]|uniref:uronyl 2-sulfotransferase-like isoform X1 n=1 Tax=Clavelina lepadiformis TaxID=159417 RepID=UPI004042D13B